jgi:predicted DNA-binding transcriptional regulator YafY
MADLALDNPQKIKLLRLMDMLRAESDEQHPFTTSRIISRLGESNISLDRRTLAKDIALLNSFGYSVVTTTVGHENAYYVERRSFSVPELKVLIDAVQAAEFIPEQDTADIVDRIAELGGHHKAEVLKENLVCFNNYKHSNSEIFSSIDQLEKAINARKKTSFYYFDLNEHGERIFRRNYSRYTVDPMALVYDSNKYYLICYSIDGVYRYRVDRMSEVSVEADDLNPNASAVREKVGEYNRTAFMMFNGNLEEVTLEFDDKILGAVQEKFGERAPVERIRVGEATYDSSGLSTRCRLTTKVQISDPFWGWLFQFSGRMKITAPPSAVQLYYEKLAAAVEEMKEMRKG